MWEWNALWLVICVLLHRIYGTTEAALINSPVPDANILHIFLSSIFKELRIHFTLYYLLIFFLSSTFVKHLKYSGMLFKHIFYGVHG